MSSIEPNIGNRALELDPDSCLYCLAPLSSIEEFSDTGLHNRCYLEWFKLEHAVPFSGFARRQAASNESEYDSKTEGNWNSSFFHGRFKKYSALLGGESYIFKVKEDIAPELPDNEYLCNQIARVLGLPIPDFYMVKFGGERAFVTKNFVRRGGSATNLVHLYHHTSPASAYDCETLIKIILNETKHLTDAETFMKTCLYDSLVGNHDRHGRNLGFLVTTKGKSLAPIYDNASALGLESGSMLKADWNPTGKIATKHAKEPTAKDYVGEFKRLGYDDVITSFIRRLKLEKILSVIEKSFCSNLMKDAMKRLVTKRYHEIFHAIKT